ncbi:MAG: sugar transferase [Candidatus Nanosynbacter sp.]|nr:sugar transferase [Candidatus Nanosynbacter sp.]
MSKKTRTKHGEDYNKSAEKRWFDSMVAAQLLVGMGSAATVAAIAMHRELGDGPTLFIQERYGSHLDNPIKVPKLRTLHGAVRNTASANGYNHSGAGPIGKLVRKAHVDEAPQLLQVLRGKMAIVGPRPLATGEVYNDILANPDIPEGLKQQWIDARKTARPGIMAPYSKDQHGLGYKLDITHIIRIMEQDIMYAKEKASLKFDSMVVAATLGTVATDLTQKLMPRSAREWLQAKTGLASAGQERAESDVVVALQQAHTQPARRAA